MDKKVLDKFCVYDTVVLTNKERAIMKYTVYHATEPTFGYNKKQKFPTDYKKVAIVESENIDDVFRITNHIDRDWTENEEVEWFLEGGQRSTSVGDVAENEAGVRFYCAPIGWELLEEVEEA